MSNGIVFNIFLIFVGAALLSTLVLYTRQSLLVAYMLLGIILGPYGLGWVADSKLVEQIGTVGIIFLLFLLGLHLHPQNLWQMLRKTSLVAVFSSIIFILICYAVCLLFKFGVAESLIVGTALMFSSTIIGLKLLPTTRLHHQHIGEVVISVLLMQDILAIIVLLVLEGVGAKSSTHWGMAMLQVILALPVLLLIAFLVEKFVLIKLIRRFDRTQEYIFLIAIAWCLGMAELARVFGLSEAIGAFIAGVALAENRISLFVAESLKPLRDFFLVLFFFAVGAAFNWKMWHQLLWPSLILAGLLLIAKPLIFQKLLQWVGEKRVIAREVGVRLGQASEFSLLIITVAQLNVPHLVSNYAMQVVQATTLLTFIISSYVVVWVYPTPIAPNDKMRRD